MSFQQLSKRKASGSEHQVHLEQADLGEVTWTELAACFYMRGRLEDGMRLRFGSLSEQLLRCSLTAPGPDSAPEAASAAQST